MPPSSRNGPSPECPPHLTGTLLPIRQPVPPWNTARNQILRREEWPLACVIRGKGVIIVLLAVKGAGRRDTNHVILGQVAGGKSAWWMGQSRTFSTRETALSCDCTVHWPVVIAGAWMPSV